MHNKAMEMAKWVMDKACSCGYDNLSSQDWDDFKDCMEVAEKAIKADYYYKLIECMKKDEEEEKRQDKFFLEMLKGENKDEYKRMREEYGEDEGEKRFYDKYRYKSSGKFAPKGHGSYMPRRGYDESPYYHMIPEDYKEHEPEYWRDVDRLLGRMYYTDASTSGGNNGSQSGNSGMSDRNKGNNSGNTRDYSDGYDDGQRRGYSEGYEQGSRDGESRGRSQGGNSRYERAKRGYEETKERHKGNTPEDKQLTMREAEKMLNVVFDEIDEMLEDAPPEMKNMVKTKGMTRFQKIS